MKLIKFITSFFPDKPVKQSACEQSWTTEEVKIFVLQLKQTIQWTRKLANEFDYNDGFYGTVFRQTNPVLNGKRLYSFDGDHAKWNLDDKDPLIYAELLKIAISSRNTMWQMDLKNIGEQGRIVSFQTGISTHDGGPINESQFFVDESDAPPIDTWFYVKNNYNLDEGHVGQTLFCWIPKSFEEMMQGAIDVEILNSYRWMDLHDPVMYELIKD